jgi:hypothetical protein
MGDSPDQFDPSTMGPIDVSSQSDGSTINEGGPAHDIEPSSLRAHVPVSRGELAMNRESDSPTPVDLQTMSEAYRPAQEDGSTSSDVDPATQRDLESATSPDAVAESDPLSSSTQQGTARSDPAESLAMATFSSSVSPDPSTVAAGWTGIRKS